jgi:hypothetical protein
VGFSFLRVLQVKKGAEERTRTADLLIRSVRLGVARRCRGLHFPHRKGGFCSLDCPPLQGIASGLGSIGVWTREFGSSEKDQRVDVLGNAVGDPGNHHPTVAVADQHRVLDPLGLRECDGPGSDLAFLVAAVLLLQRERYGRAV